MKCIYVGSPFPEEFVKNRYSRQEFSLADNKAQLSLLRGLSKQYQKNLYVLTSNQNFDNKHSKRVWFRKGKIQILPHVQAIAVANFNLNRISFYLTTMISMTCALFKLVSKIRKKNKDEEIVIISFNPHIFYSYPVHIVNKFYHFKSICFLVGTIFIPDLTGVAKWVNLKSLKAFQKFDGVITYVEKSCEDYTSAPYIPILYSLDYTPPLIQKKPLKKKKVLVYTGAFTEISGVDILLKTVSYLPKEYHLILCGTGPLKHMVEEYTKKYPNIEYRGLVSSKEAIEIQRQADLLLLLRSNRNEIDEYYATYAASGKLIEYLSTGVPVLAFKVGAFPHQLLKYLNFTDTLDPIEIAKKIENLFGVKQYQDLLKRSKEGRKFVIDHAKEEVQNKNIIHFIELLMKKNK